MHAPQFPPPSLSFCFLYFPCSIFHSGTKASKDEEEEKEEEEKEEEKEEKVVAIAICYDREISKKLPTPHAHFAFHVFFLFGSLKSKSVKIALFITFISPSIGSINMPCGDATGICI